MKYSIHIAAKGIELRFCAEVGLVVGRASAKPCETAEPFRGVDSLSRNENAKRAPVKGALCILVEARGIEPLSENHLIQLSPSAADLLRVPSRIADRQAMRYGSHYAVTVGVAPRRSRSPLFDAPHPAAVLRGRTGGLIKPPRQRYCCSLLFEKL